VTADPTQIPGGESISSSIYVTATIGVEPLSLIIGTATIPAHAVFGDGYTQALPAQLEVTGVFLPTVEK
jgi:hypothetical protein